MNRPTNRRRISTRRYPATAHGAQQIVVARQDGFMTLKAAVLSLAVFLCFGICQAQNFAPAVNYMTGSLPFGSAAADFNNDGNVDVIVANSGATTLSLFLGNGDGTFQPARTIQVGLQPFSVVTGDFNGDGNMDIAISGISGSPAIEILFGNGNGTFQTPIKNIPVNGLPDPSPAPFFIGELAVGDLNSDKKPDLVAATANGVAAFLNDGSGNFTFSGWVAQGQVVQNVALADFNNDGIADLVFAVSGNAPVTSPNVFLSLGNGDGTFKSPSTLPITAQNPFGIAVADVNKDGLLDVIVDDFGTSSGAILAATQQPGGSFAQGVTLSFQSNPDGVFAADLNGDGNVDIAVAIGTQPSMLVVFTGFGDGSFSIPIQFSVGPGATHPIAAHLTNTVAFDAITSGNSGNEISALVNHSSDTLNLASSVNPSVTGQPVKLTAVVQPRFPNSGTFSGSLIFADGNKTLGTAPVNSSGVGSLLTSFPSAGSHSLLAVFGGNSSFVGGSSATLTQVVNPATPTVSLIGTVNPSSFGQQATFNITVSGPTGGTSPTGTVNLLDGGSIILSGALDKTGQVALSTSSLSVGSHTLTAQYPGDSNYTTATSPSLTQTVGKGASSTTLVASPAPSTFGQSVTFTATVTPAAGSGTPTGTVTFSEGSNSFTANLDATGKATVTTSTLTAGTHNVNASYSGDANFTGSSGSFSETVNKGGTATAIASSLNPATFGQTVTFTATVTAQGNSTVPTGSVSFSDGATALGSAPLDAQGKAVLATAALSVGSHNVIANYSGDSNFSISASTALAQVINRASSTTTLTTSPNPSTFGQGIALTAIVAPPAGVANTPAGTVTFTNGGTSLGTSNLDNSGKASLTVSTLPAGANAITASYGGDGNFQPSNSQSVAQTVNKSGSTTSLTSSANPSSFGQTITLSVAVGSASGNGTLSGTVNFLDGSSALGSAALDNNGKATFTTASLSVGSHSLSASFSGDGNFQPSTSAPTTQVVIKSTTSTVITSSQPSSSFGQSVTFSAAVTPTGNGNGVATGVVSFTDGANALGSVSLDSSGKASFSISTLSAGTHNVTASYAGDGNFSASASTPIQQVVNKGATSTTITASPNPSVFGQQIVLTVTVSATSGTGNPSGSVSITDGITALGTVTVDNSGKASLTVSSLTVGTHSIAANYGGDNNFSSSASSPIQQVVNKSATTTIFTASPNPSLFGQSIVLSVTVNASSGTGVPSGTVTVNDGSTSLGTATLGNTGKATITVNSLPVGSHTLTAAYSGDANLNPSTASGAGAITQVVNQSNSVTTISSSANPSVFGQVVTITALVGASNGGSGVPGGTVTFMEGTTVLGKASLDGTGSATLSTANLAVGSHNVSVTYAGDTNFVASTSNALTETVNRNSISISLTSVPNPSTFGQTVTVTVHVVPSPPGGSPGTMTPTGSMTFSDGTSTLGTVTLDSTGSATFTVNNFAVGTHTITASYGGDANFSKGSSNPEIQIVNRASTATTLTTSMNPTTNASTVILVAAVKSQSGIPTGSISFFDGTTQLGSGQLDDKGTATLTVADLSIGSHGLGATYAGDNNFMNSQSSIVPESIKDSHSTVLLTSSANPEVVTQTVTFMAVVSSALGGPVVGGAVTFANGNTILATVPVVNSTASFNTAALPVGNDEITAVYQATTTPGPFDGSASLVENISSVVPTLIISSGDQDFTIAVDPRSSTIRAGETFTAQLSLTPLQRLTGPVEMLCTGTPQNSTCAINPIMGSFDGKTPIAATVVLQTAASTSASLAPVIWRHKGLGPFQYVVTAFVSLLLLGTTVISRGTIGRFSGISSVLLIATLAGCGGTRFHTKPLNAGTPPGTYTLNIQASSGSTTHSVQIQLIVQ